ncbi:Ferredoxin-NADP reductase [Amycolatopsis sacchari]|uniref:Ferredoxin-NADP reductase n=1 Tax=Amycolatopsis sacchari TaxID=115433 RepID=A0A1I3T1L1_9PSEU|nr:MOSC and FAD-binding oxidoreductase domain-containing protein [Amycolatopsis sacchari]SFJ63731.1 Ferredoxin-NADP reductase [Amycolatopsis sacchari]
MATLVSVNVGMPADVPWRGRTVHTGVYKRPVTGARVVRRLNVDGDGQGDLGGHGGEHRAVLVYQTEAYRFWRAELGREDLEPGAFGENFTVDGLLDAEVCIGDRYRIGGALFEVSQPRVTCYRVGLRLGEERMAALLVSRRRPGFYLRVLEEGEVEAGQEIVKVAGGPEGMTVEELDGLLYLPGHTREQVERALRIPALSPGWQGSLRKLLDRADNETDGSSGNVGLTDAASAPPPGWPGFRPLRVVDVKAESREVLSLTLADPGGAPLPDARPGQFLTVKVPAGDTPLVRSYSLSGGQGVGRYRISVKIEPHGAAGARLRDEVRAGSTLDAAAPRGVFSLQDGEDPVVLLSAGIGVTPVLAMLHALARARSEREVWWLHGARDGSEHPFAGETRALLGKLPHARSFVYYSRPRAADRRGADYTEAGRLTEDVIRALALPTTADAYVCGPAGFLTDMTQALTGCGLAPGRVHTEVFGALGALTPGLREVTTTPHPPPGPPGGGPAVSFARSGLTVAWDDRHGSLLELAEACDVPVRWSCRTGVCHTCELALLSGAVGYRPEPLEPPADGNVLICCAKPAEPVVLDL